MWTRLHPLHSLRVHSLTPHTMIFTSRHPPLRHPPIHPLTHVVQQYFRFVANIIDIFIVAFCILTLVLLHRDATSGNDKLEKMLDTVLLVFRWVPHLMMHARSIDPLLIFLFIPFDDPSFGSPFSSHTITDTRNSVQFGRLYLMMRRGQQNLTSRQTYINIEDDIESAHAQAFGDGDEF